MTTQLDTTTQTDMAALLDHLAGPMFLPGDPGYDQECATFNLLTPLSPLIVIGASCTRDVQLAVRFAAEHDLAVAVRGGGHLQPHSAKGAVLLTLDRMRTVAVEPDRRTARITGTPSWRDVLDTISPHGLAAMNGSSSTVGAVGYLLGGGMSHTLGRTYGYASDHVSRIEVVTADGEHRTATAYDNADLFFALRGGKGNLGVVTAVEFALFPISKIFGGGLWFSGERLAEILPLWRDWVRTLPEEATSSLAIQRLPPLPELPEPLRGRFTVHIRFSFVGSTEVGEALIEPIRELAPDVFDTLAEIPFRDNPTIHADPPTPLPYSDRSLGLSELTDETIAALVSVVGPDSGCPLVSVELRALGGALDRAPATPDAVPSRGLPFQWFAFGVGGPDDAPRMRAYLTTCVEQLAPWAHPRKMVNFVSPEEALRPSELRSVYGAELYDRLLAVKGKYDPHNMFRVNHNIANVSPQR